MRLSNYVPVRMTAKEKARLREIAEAAGLSVSELIRRYCFGRSVNSKVDLTMVRELRRLGGLLKHIHNESGGAYREETAQMLREIGRVITELGRDDR